MGKGKTFYYQRYWRPSLYSKMVVPWLLFPPSSSFLREKKKSKKRKEKENEQNKRENEVIVLSARNPGQASLVFIFC